MPVNSSVSYKLSPPPHIGHGWMWVERNSSLTFSLSLTHSLTHTLTHTLSLFLCLSLSLFLSHYSVFITPPLSHRFSLRCQCMIVKVWQENLFESSPFSLSFSCCLLNSTASFQPNHSPAVSTDWSILTSYLSVTEWMQVLKKKKKLLFGILGLRVRAINVLESSNNRIFDFRLQYDLKKKDCTVDLWIAAVLLSSLRQLYLRGVKQRDAFKISWKQRSLLKGWCVKSYLPYTSLWLFPSSNPEPGGVA